jgi:glycine cleavage system H lipoate-binding protein
MRSLVAEAEHLEWKGVTISMTNSTPDIQAMKALPPSQRPCLHHVKGRIRFKPCTNDYLCGNCEFDQYFYDEYAVHAVVRPIQIMEVEGFKVPQGYYLHEGHAWVKIEEGSSVRIGIDDFALRLLGPLDRVEAPLMGKVVNQGEPGLAVRRGEHHAKLLSPLSGVITALNPRLREQGNLANDDPYAGGWVMTLHPQNLRKEIKSLMIARQSAEFVEQEVGRLHHLMEEAAAPLAADGGTLGKDVFGAMPNLGWDRLTRAFLHTPPCS